MSRRRNRPSNFVRTRAQRAENTEAGQLAERHPQRAGEAADETSEQARERGDAAACDEERADAVVAPARARRQQKPGDEAADGAELHAAHHAAAERAGVARAAFDRE